MKHMYGKTSAAEFLEKLVIDDVSVRKKVMTSMSEFNHRIKGLDRIQDDDLYFFYVNLTPVDTDLQIPEKVSTVMRNVKIGIRRKAIANRKYLKQKE
jgi:hypothetical protein